MTAEKDLDVALPGETGGESQPSFTKRLSASVARSSSKEYQQSRNEPADSPPRSTVAPGAGVSAVQDEKGKFYVAVSSSRRIRQKTRSIIRDACEAIADNKFVVIFGIILTIWALTADDMRLLLTNRPSDPIFDGLVIFCILFFFFELVVSCIGKHDYFMSFFFTLDVVATVTLVLDLTFVSDALFHDGGGEESDKARSSKTARAGARVGRVVRVLRLVRIVKLFKAWQEAQAKKVPKKPKFDADFDWEADFAEDDGDDPSAGRKESLVGQKLSARTTQRTIILVLVMLIVMPFLSAGTFQQTPASAEYGADDVTEAFKAMTKNETHRSAYARILLRYIYYHNWHTHASGECPKAGAGCSIYFFSQLFWVGITGNDAGDLRTNAVNARLQPTTVNDWDQKAKIQGDLFNYGQMPTEVVDLLGSPWADCQVGENRRLYGIPLIKMEDYAVDCPADLRLNEMERFVPRLMSFDEYRQMHFVFYFDLRPFVKDECKLNLMKTLIVCIVLCVASSMFSADAQNLVLEPVEEMIRKVEAIRDDPLSAIRLADEEFKREEVKKIQIARKKERRKLSKLPNLSIEDMRRAWKGERQEMMETVILEKTIIKLGSLLALGFGQAGVNIVSHNMKGSRSANVDCLIKGSRVDCIIGITRIQDFSIVIEVLQGKVMTFVNQVAEIVHGIVDQFQGAVNKNNGDTFLAIWLTANLTPEEKTRMAEMSVVAFTRIIGSIHSSPMLATYRHHPGLQQRLRTAAGCRVNVAFGLHSGWAIEGAVGSEFKIDASYLSPNVSIATSIERATRIYQVSMIVSEEVAHLLTPDMAAKMRLIDRVRIEGSTKPLKLYCMDLHHMNLPVDEPMTPLLWNTRQRYISRQKLAAEKQRKWDGGVSMTELWTVPQIVEMRRQVSAEFKHVFGMGFQNYTEGEWQVARLLLSRAQTVLGTQDGPSGALLRFMETPHGFQAPAGWQGVRDLGNLDGT